MKGELAEVELPDGIGQAVGEMEGHHLRCLQAVVLGGDGAFEQLYALAVLHAEVRDLRADVGDNPKKSVLLRNDFGAKARTEVNPADGA